jgi:dihydrofolate reductase
MAQADQHHRGRSTGMVLWHVTMSVDGFIAGPDDTMDWVFDYPSQPNPAVEEVIQTTGAILAGRRWYDVATSRYGGRAGIYGGSWTGPVFVLTHRSDHDVSDPGVTLLSDGVTDAVATTLAAADGKNIGIFGANLAQQCLAAGLVDEILVHLAPVLLGDGTRLYGGPGTGRVNLEPISVAQSGQLTDLRFRALK